MSIAGKTAAFTIPLLERIDTSRNEIQGVGFITDASRLPLLVLMPAITCPEAPLIVAYLRLKLKLQA